MRYAIVIERAGENYSAYVPDLPGCVATGSTVEETSAEVAKAIDFHIEGTRDEGFRRTTMRIRERDLVIPSLREARSAGGFIETSVLIDQLEQQFVPDGEDADILDSRSDTKFSQKVRNLISHRNGANSMFTKGYAIYVEEREGIKITTKGCNFLDQVPE